VDHADIGWILVHLDQLSPGPRAVWEKARTAGLERVGDWQDALLFRVTQAPRDDRRDRLFDRHQTPAGTSLQPLDACQGKIIVVPLKRLRGAEPGARVPIHVTLRNESHSTWPGFAVWTDQLVQVEISVKQNGRYLRPSEEFPLDDDLPPGAAYEEGLAAYMPMAPGAYELEVAATQGGVSLERCGLAPSLLPIEVVKR
jgi:hypothetical protein